MMMSVDLMRYPCSLVRALVDRLPPRYYSPFLFVDDDEVPMLSLVIYSYLFSPFLFVDDDEVPMLSLVSPTIEVVLVRCNVDMTVTRVTSHE